MRRYLKEQRGRVDLDQAVTDGIGMLGELAKRRSRHGRVMALSMMKDEGPYVLEWVAHHLAVGFSEILVFTNDCSDGTDEMLKRLEALGLVTHRENIIPEGKKPQPNALRLAEKDPVVRGADWILVLDADEFLAISHGEGSVDGLLDDVIGRDANGIVITWRTFGSGGHTDWTPAPITERYTTAAPEMWNKGWGVKTLFRNDLENLRLGIHRPIIRKEQRDTDYPETIRWLNGSGEVMDPAFRHGGWRSDPQTVGYGWAQLNHYAVQSMESYALRRLRGNVNNKTDKYNASYWALQDRNEVEDTQIARHEPERRRILAALLSDPVLARLHREAIGVVERRLASLRHTPDYAALMKDLSEGSALPLHKVAATTARKLRIRGERQKRKQDGASAKRIDPRGVLYKSGAVPKRVSAHVPWRETYGIELPEDPALFTREGLAQIVNGRFQRNLVRNLPGLVGTGGTCVEVGGGVGFLSLVLSRQLEGVRLLMAERDRNWAGVLDDVIARNGGLARGLERVEYQEILSEEKAKAPELLIIGDASLSDAEARALLAAVAPRAVILAGRLFAAESARPQVVAACKSAGLSEPIAEIWKVALGLRRPRG